MPDLIDPQVETRATTQAEPAGALELEQVLEAERRANPEADEPDTSTPFPREVSELTTSHQHSIRLVHWKSVGDWGGSWAQTVHAVHGDLHSNNIIFHETRATTSTATTVTAVRELLRRMLRDERISRLSPERRELYDRMRTRRKEISRDEFDIDAAIREFREDG